MENVLVHEKDADEPEDFIEEENEIIQFDCQSLCSVVRAVVGPKG